MGLLPRTQLSLLPSVSTLPAVSFRGCSVHDCSPVPSAELQVHTLDFGRSFLLGNIAQALAFFKSPGLSHMCIAQSFVFLTSASVSYCILPSLLSGASILACFYSWTQLHWAPSLDGSHFHPSDLFTSDQLRHLDGFTVSFGEVGGLSPPAEQSLSILSYRKTVQIPVPPFSVPPLTSASLPTTWGPWTRPAWLSLGLGSRRPSYMSSLPLTVLPCIRGKAFTTHLFSSVDSS